MLLPPPHPAKAEIMAVERSTGIHFLFATAILLALLIMRDVRYNNPPSHQKTCCPMPRRYTVWVCPTV
jgi:hypothetical protein